MVLNQSGLDPDGCRLRQPLELIAGWLQVARSIRAGSKLKTWSHRCWLRPVECPICHRRLSLVEGIAFVDKPQLIRGRRFRPAWDLTRRTRMDDPPRIDVCDAHRRVQSG
jgi:hypothetical protein